MKVVIDKAIPFINGILEPFIDVDYLPGDKINNATVKDADALIIRTRTACNEKLLKGSKVRFIASATIGFDHIDTDYCDRQGITWTNAPGCNSSSVQQYMASVLLHLASNKNLLLKQRTIGIVGVGNVGKKVMRLTEYLGMRVVLNDPPRMRNESPCGFVSLEGIMREADIITFHVPLSFNGQDKTFHMVNDEFLKNVNSGTLIINTSRGEVIDTRALKNAKQSGKIDGAVLDVWENEPDIDTDMLQLADIVTPHIAGYSADGKANGTAMSVQALSKFFGLELNDWYPEDVPEPENYQIIIDGKDKMEQEVYFEAVTSTYDIGGDDKRLRENVAGFENLRGNYPLRREFGAYQLKLKNVSIEVKRNLRNLGFKIANE